VPGLVLIIVGAILLLARQQVLSGDLTVLLIGALLLAVYAASGATGLLIPGAILTGLGAGIALRERFGPESATVPLGLGVGFVAIYVIALVYEGRSSWWPLSHSAPSAWFANDMSMTRLGWPSAAARLMRRPSARR